MSPMYFSLVSFLVHQRKQYLEFKVFKFPYMFLWFCSMLCAHTPHTAGAAGSRGWQTGLQVSLEHCRACPRVSVVPDRSQATVFCFWFSGCMAISQPPSTPAPTLWSQLAQAKEGHLFKHSSWIFSGLIAFSIFNLTHRIYLFQIKYHFYNLVPQTLLKHS